MSIYLLGEEEIDDFLKNYPSLFDTMQIECEKDEIPYVKRLKKYLLKHYGKPFCENIDTYGIGDINPGKLLKLVSTNEKGEEINLKLWIFKTNKGYKIYEQLSNKISHIVVLTMMGEIFLKYYLEEEKGIPFDCYLQSTTIMKHSYILNAQKKGYPLKISYYFDRDYKVEDDKIKRVAKYADIFFKYSHTHWEIIKVVFIKEFVLKTGKIKNRTLGTLSSATINKTIKKIGTDEQYNKYINISTN
jgi:hypothetical protein